MWEIRVKAAMDSIPVGCLYSQRSSVTGPRHPALEPGIELRSPDSQSRSQCKDVAVLTPCPCQHPCGPPGVRKFPHQPLLRPCLLGQNPGFPGSSAQPPVLPRETGLRSCQQWATSWRNHRRGEQMLLGVSCRAFVGQKPTLGAWETLIRGQVARPLL